MDVVRHELREFVRDLSKRPQVSKVTQQDPEAYAATDLGVSVTLRIGATVDFWVYLELGEVGWMFSYTVQRSEPDEDGSHAERTLVKRSVESPEQLPGALVSAIRELRFVAAGDDALFR